MLLSIDTGPFRDVIREHDVAYHKYSDDMVLYVVFDPSVTGDVIDLSMSCLLVI